MLCNPSVVVTGGVQWHEGVQQRLTVHTSMPKFDRLIARG